MAYLTRSLKTKTGDAPSSINRLVRTVYPLLIAFDKDFPGHLEAIIREVDLLERNHDAAWYSRNTWAILRRQRGELTKQQPPLDALKGLTAGIGSSA